MAKKKCMICGKTVKGSYGLTWPNGKELIRCLKCIQRANSEEYRDMKEHAQK